MATFFEISAKSHHFSVKFLFVLFLLFAVVNSATDPASNPTSKMASDTLFSADVSPAASKTTEFHPRKREINPGPKGNKVESVAGDKHEVPSGPNPISN